MSVKKVAERLNIPSRPWGEISISYVRESLKNLKQKGWVESQFDLKRPTGGAIAKACEITRQGREMLEKLNNYREVLKDGN